MPIYLRKFYLKRLNKQIEDQNKAIEKAQNKSKSTSRPSFSK